MLIATNKIKSWATENTHYITQIRGYEVGEVLPNSAEQYASVLPFGGLLQSEYAQTKNYSFRSSLVYNKMFNEDHRLTLNLGFQVNSVSSGGECELAVRLSLLSGREVCHGSNRNNCRKRVA